VLLTGHREASLAGVRVDDDEEAPLALRGRQHRAQRLLPRVVDGARRQAGVHVGVVRRGVGAIAGGGGDPALAVGVVHGGVELQRHAVGEPVLQDPRDLGHVLGGTRLGLHQAGLGQHGEPRLLGDLQLVEGVFRPVDHLGEHLDGGGAGLEVVRRREQPAFEHSAGVVRQAQGGRVRRGRLQLRQGRPRRLGDLGQRGLDSQALGEGHPGDHPGGGVEQQVDGRLAAHLLAHAVDARLDARRGGIGLGGGDERADGGDDPAVDQRAGDVAERVSLVDPHVHAARALPGEVTGGVDHRQQLLAADDDAGDQAAQDHEREQHRPRAAAGAHAV
jgi:hypothetical protein